MDKVVAIQGMQYGSEAKGAIAAGVARRWKPDTVATAWGPNAGHTVRDGDFKFVSTMLATGALYPSTQNILIGPGSVVDLNKLAQEVELAGERLRGKTMVIHPQAPFLKPEHAELERDLLRIGSTMKGTMQAAVSKMHRNESAVIRSAGERLDPLNLAASKVGLSVSTSERLYDAIIDSSSKMVLEGAQGFSLGIHGQFYPYCTSRDVSTAQLFADCRLPYVRRHVSVIGVLRTYPIRVANRRSDDGQEFTSGGFYEDQHELDWKADLGREPELTTVTKLPRRIFTFSYEQIRRAMRIMQPNLLAMTFCDYLEDPPVLDSLERGHVGQKVLRRIEFINEMASMSMFQPCRVHSVSYGPDLSDIYNIVNITGGVRHDPFNLDDDE